MHSLNNDAAIWSDPGADRPLVLLLHGYGSNEQDLAGLFGYLPSEFQYVSLRAPLENTPGYAWFPLTMYGATLAIQGGRESAHAVAAWCQAQGVDPVGAIGFSQGGATALEVLREAEIPSLNWVAVLSGFVLDIDPDADGNDQRDAAMLARKPHVFWARGTADFVITPDHVARTLQWLPAHAEARIELYPNLTHSISADELSDLGEWMRERLG